MEDASPALFRPTWQQALGRGVHLGALVSVAGLAVLLSLWIVGTAPPAWLWVALAFGPPVLAAPVGVLAERRAGCSVSAGGIQLSDGVARWDEVVDLRTERRGNRTVVSVYLQSGASAQLRAPYSGDLFASDPRFEAKTFALSYLWRSNRFGGLPG